MIDGVRSGAGLVDDHTRIIAPGKTGSATVNAFSKTVPYLPPMTLQLA